MSYSSGARFSRAKPTGSFRVLQPSTRRVASHDETLKDARASAAYWTSAVSSPMEIQERFPSGAWVTIDTVQPKSSSARSAPKRVHATPRHEHATKKDYDWEAFTKGAAFAFWASPYISEVENLAEDAREAGDARKEAAFMAAYRALSPGPGGHWDRVLGDPPPAVRAVAKKFTKQVRDSLTDDQLAEIFATFSAEKAGYKGAMQAQGEGVGWFDEGVKIDPPRGFSYDVKIANAVGRAITRDAREAGAPLPRR